MTDACSHVPPAAPNKLYVADCLSSHSPHFGDLSLGASTALHLISQDLASFNTNCHLHMISCTAMPTARTNHTPTNLAICTVSATHWNGDNCRFKSSNMHSKLSTVSHQLTSSSRGLRAISYCYMYQRVHDTSILDLENCSKDEFILKIYDVKLYVEKTSEILKIFFLFFKLEIFWIAKGKAVLYFY